MKLDAPYGASIPELKASFRRLAMLCHPDKCPNKDWAAKEFRELLDDLHLRINRQEKVKRVPRHDVPLRRIVKSVLFGYSAEYSRGEVFISLYVPMDIEQITVLLMKTPNSYVALETFKERDTYRFTFQPPRDFKSGIELEMNNLPFKCKVTLYYAN